MVINIKIILCSQILRTVKTKQVTYSILKRLSDYVKNLEEIGLLGKREMVHLDDAVQVCGGIIILHSS